MTEHYYRQRWNELVAGRDLPAARTLAEQVALAFLDRYLFSDCFEEEDLRLLCEMAMSAELPDANAAASGALFGIIVETLCDDFEDLQTEAYNRVMGHILMFCREHEQGQRFAQAMAQFGLHSFRDLLGRAERLRKTSCNFRELCRRPRRILFLSRVTFGADVAATSVAMQRFERLYPEAEPVLIGSAKLRQLFGGHPRLRVHPVEYTRRGDLLARLASWFDVLAAVEAESRDAEGEVLLVDPDSRLSQLGVFPLLDDAAYLFFNSRSRSGYPDGLSITEMINQWVDRVSGRPDFCYPAVWLNAPDLERSRRLAETFRAAGCRRLVTVNFGVGGNNRKRIHGCFERELLLQTLEPQGTVVVLDRGFGSEEETRCRELLKEIAAAGHPAAELDFAADRCPPLGHGLLAVGAPLGGIAALITSSDEYLGYDSACQHLAAAQEVDTCTVFAGSNNTRFVRRWRPFGLGRNEIVHVDTLSHPPVLDIQAILHRIRILRKERM